MSAPAVRFDLTSEPWIPALTSSGQLVHLGLTELVQRAGELRCVLGDVPTQTFALLRLVEAVLHRALDTTEVTARDRWLDCWQGGIDLGDVTATYLERHQDRFDLLHPTAPFYQVAGLSTAKDAVASLSSLFPDVPNGHQFFSTRAGRGLVSASFAEAARGLVHAQAFDPSGIKSGAVGDPRVKGGKGYPIGTGWAGRLGGLYLEGADLRQTLLLNLVAEHSSGHPWPQTDSAVWERTPQGAAPEGRAGASGPADQLTWQSRRIRLAITGERVTGVLIANGDPLAPHKRNDYELMTTWRRSPTQEKALKEQLVYMPLEHQPERSLWRGLPALLPTNAGAGASGGEPSQRLPSGVISWAMTLVDDGDLAEDFPLRVHAVGMKYGSQSSVVDDVLDDAMPLHSVLLGQQGIDLRQAAVLAVEATDKAVRALGHLAQNLTLAAGGKGQGSEGAYERARELGFATLDAPFRSWLRSLQRGDNALERRAAWELTARTHLLRLGEELQHSAGQPAWVGRLVRQRQDDPGRWLDTSVARGWFLRALDAALITTVPHSSSPPVLDSAGSGTHAHEQDLAQQALDQPTHGSSPDQEDGAA